MGAKTKEEDDEVEEDEEEDVPKKTGESAKEAKHLDSLTDAIDEDKTTSSKVDAKEVQAKLDEFNKRKEEADRKRAEREKQLAQERIKKEDLDLMCSELPLCDRDVLDRLLRVHRGDLKEALRSAVRIVFAHCKKSTGIRCSNNKLRRRGRSTLRICLASLMFYQAPADAAPEQAMLEGQVYLFHTGKSRWVISKKVNDGARCYAFVSDDGYADPTQCPGPWICCGEDGQWREDRNIKCVPAKASQDKFVLLRNEVEEDLKHFGLMDSNSLKQLWKKLDKNGNNIVSLAEIDSLVVDMVKASLWPEWVNNKDAIRRAYEKTAKLDGDGEGDDVEKEEFHSLLLNLFWFGHLHRIFDEIDTSHDGRLTLEEFTAGMAQLDLHLSPEEARREYSTIDMDHGGMILFTEFCAYIRRRVHPDHNPAFDADIVSKDKSNETLRKKHGDKATHGHFVNKKSLADFDKLEKELKDVLKANDQAQLKKMWKRLDFNGNNIVSLAEVGKMVNEQYPVLNHQPALMRAFKATLERGNGDEWVQKAEFKMLLGNLFYFNKLYWLFDQVDEDHDRRMTLKEFQWCMSVCGIKMSQAKSEAEFKKVDVNGGGIILFDEFCRYFADKHCPEAMQDSWHLNMISRLRDATSRVASPVQALLVTRRSLHRAPGLPWTIYHPHIQEPEHTKKIVGETKGLARYIPKNYRHQQFIESVRSGEYLGPDWPYNMLSSVFWKERRYNATYNPIPPDMSVLPGILFFPRLNVWCVEWWEQDKQRFRWFRACYGFMRAKQHAEDFRRSLIEAGRVDNRRTDREIRIQLLARIEAKKLLKKKFSNKDARRLGNSGSKQGSPRRARRDYQKRGLLP
ncbi:unnamed protein product [Symbiodinium sp. KB8]|nr:unnamed protein product [Symbiodinium sp. KB8]